MSNQPAASNDALVESLAKLPRDRFELWKYFEDRADLLTERLWTTGTWLLGILTAILTLPFAAKFVEVAGGLFPLTVKAHLPLGVVAAFGCACSVYAVLAIADLKDHIESNWRRALYARTEQWDGSVSLPRRKTTGWLILLGILILELVAFLGLFVLACLP